MGIEGRLALGAAGTIAVGTLIGAMASGETKHGFGVTDGAAGLLATGVAMFGSHGAATNGGLWLEPAANVAHGNLRVAAATLTAGAAIGAAFLTANLIPDATEP